MHYVSHYWANCSNIFFKPPCIENIIKDVKAMLAYLLYTCNEIVDKVQCIETNEQKSRYFYYTRVLVQKKIYIFLEMQHFILSSVIKKKRKRTKKPFISLNDFFWWLSRNKRPKEPFCLSFLFFKYWNKSNEKESALFFFMVIQSSVL